MASQIKEQETIAPLPNETLGRLYWRLRGLPLRANLVKAAPNLDVDEFLRPLERLTRPWPAWVLKMYARIYHVSFPTIELSIIEDAILWLHWLCLEPEKESPSKTPPKLSLSNSQLIDLFGRILGHMAAQTTALEEKVTQLGPSVPKDFLGDLHKSNRTTWEFAASTLKSGSLSDGVQFSKSLVEAESGTFDDHGQRRESLATAIYEEMVKNWPEIERLSGPTALCRYLENTLWPGKAEENLDRVKKICSRFQIRFETCKGTSIPPRPVTSELAEI